MVIEDALIKRVGEAGKKLHTGRSRNDQVATDLSLWLQQNARRLSASINGVLQPAFVQLAMRSSGIVIPSFTHLQRAQPIDAGAESLAWAEMLDHDMLRLNLAVEAGSQLPLGSGAIAGSSLPLDPYETIDSLQMADDFATSSKLPTYTSFGRAPTNAIEHTASRDAACDFLYACAMIAMHLSRWAEQWIIYSSTEFGFIKIADRYTTGSSMMPQKRNPDMLELIRGRCGGVYGNLVALLTILKGLPIGYNRDLQEDKRHVFAAYDTVSSCLTMAAAIVNSAEFVKENIEPTLERGFLDATSLAEYLVTKDVPFRTAHQVVGSLVRKCEESNRHQLAQLSVAEMNDALKAHGSAVGLTDDVYNALGAHNVVKRYQSAGAAGGKPFEDQLRAWKQRLGL
jgi:argininosuccinate lyase